MRTSRGCALWLVLLLAALGLAPATARADQVVPNCSDDPACLSLYDRAKAASNAGDLDEALRLYKLAHEVRADPLLLFSIARILHKQGKTQEAVPYYTRFLAAPTDDPAPRKKAEEYLAQLRGQSPPTAEPPTDPSPKTDPATASESKPIYKKWWFWTLISVGVAGGVAAGVAVAATNSAPSGNGLPEGVTTVKWTF